MFRTPHLFRTAGRWALIVAALGAASSHARAQTPVSTAFTYQGELRQSGSPATGAYDVRFLLFDAATGGTQLGSTLCTDNLAVASGRFTASLDFGSQFAGQRRFLEV